MKICTYCGKTSNETRIINNSKHGLLCNACDGKFRRGVTTNPIPKYGEIELDENGNPICHICGEGHKKTMSHVWHKHKISALEYKKKFGLETTKGIMHNDLTTLARKNNKKHYDIVVKENLIKKGIISRYEKGCEGRTKEKVSEQTRLKLTQNFVKIREKQRKQRDN